jgi:RNA polymerase sigma-70 factor (ECF subfamily)
MIAASPPATAFDRGKLIELARAAGLGDAQALSALVSSTSGIVWRCCAALVDRGSADDLTQETYLRAMRSLASYRGEADPTHWLLTIARRVCAEEVGRRQRARAIEQRLLFERPPEHSQPHALCDLSDGLARLSPERREAFVLTAVAGLSYAEAAEICGCPVGTIRSRVSRARAELIAMLAADTDTDTHRVACAEGTLVNG